MQIIFFGEYQIPWGPLWSYWDPQAGHDCFMGSHPDHGHHLISSIPGVEILLVQLGCLEVLLEVGVQVALRLCAIQIKLIVY